MKSSSRIAHNGNRPRHLGFALKALPAALALVFSQAGAAADIAGAAGLPQNGTVFSGSATGSVMGTELTINQTSNRAVLDWTSFNIDAGKSVRFIQPGVGSAALNRVNGDANPSQILGSLSANGTVMLMNPNGVMFGANSIVNVGSLIATTGNIDVNSFISSGSALITGATGSITNAGAITAQGAGLVALVAPSVVNQGSIVATGGTIALAGSTAATLSLNGGLYVFAIPSGATGTSVSNAVGASLNGATIRIGVGDAANLVSGVINLEGVQSATTEIVVNADTVVLKSALQGPAVSGNSNKIDVYNGARIQDAVKVAKTGTPGAGAAVNVHGGSYEEQVVLNKANMTLTGQDGAKIIVPEVVGSQQLNGISIQANNVTVSGMEIAGPVSVPYIDYPWAAGITRGIAVANGVSNFTISNNNIHDVRNGILIDGRNTGSVTDNRIENTKGAISVQYTDGNGINISGNSQGQIGNDWGLNLHLNGSWDGTTIHANPVSAAPTLAWQQALLDLSSSNGGLTVQDQGYTSSNRTHVDVASGGSASSQGSLLAPIDTVQGGINAVVTGGTVKVAAGTYAENVSITKALTLDGAGIGQTVLKAPSALSGNAVSIDASNVTMSDLSVTDSFYGLQLKGISNNVTIDRVAFVNNTYGVRNGTSVKADNFRMLDSSITGGLVGFQTYNGYQMINGVPVATGSFANALFQNVTIDGPTFKGFYFETADNLTLKNVTITNSGNYGDPGTGKYGSAIDVNLKYANFGNLTFDNVVVKNSGNSSGDPTRAAVVIKTRGIPGDGAYTSAPATLQAVNIIGGSIKDSSGTGLRIETLSSGSGAQSAVTISGGTLFRNNAQDIVVEANNVDARGAVFAGAADGFAIEDRVTHALDASGRGLVTWEDGKVYVTQSSGSIQRGVDAVAVDGTVNVGAGSFVQPATLNINKGVTIAGSGEATTIIDARTVTGYGMNVTGDNVTLKDFTLYGPSTNASWAYGIKVEPASGNASARLRNFSMGNVTIRGSGRAELDLNGVDTASIDHVTADGSPVGNAAGSTAGSGIQLTDSANVSITNSSTRNNEWGGLAFYQKNRFYNQQMNNITVAANNSFTESNPVYLQDESVSMDFGSLNIAGFDYAVRNASLTNSNYQYTWLQSTQQKALDFAVNAADSASSYVQGWNGNSTTQEFQVGVGNLLGGGMQAMRINTALDNAGSGANIRVGAGTYAENVVVNNPYNLYFNSSTVQGLTLNSGAAGTGLSGAVTASGSDGILFNAPVKLLGDTTLATLGADITLNGDIQNASGVARALRLTAGSGNNRGDVHMLSGGTDLNVLGSFDVVSNKFSLLSTLWIKGYSIDALGNVALSNHTLRAQDANASNTLNSGGDITGATISQGSVQITSSGDMAANITARDVAVVAGGDVSGNTVSQGNVQISSTGNIQGNISGSNVVVQAQGDVNVVVTASSSASVGGDSVIASVSAPVVTVAAVSDAQVSGSSSQITVNAPSGSVSGNFGQVTNSGSGLLKVNGKPQGSQALSSNAENNRVVPQGNSLEDNAAGDQDSNGVTLALASGLSADTPANGQVSISTVDSAGEALQSGGPVQIDLSAGNDKKKKK